ncbi:hypothetical protein [Neotamlana laminarinivorans]|uniref:DUF4412 domain-containing protein n=1 Tax=Neotamlana laminarinivorans TaxID=2883124 RepID=A0A9X1HYP6_9FLAO|nr:hypothetical protein [Tamlana laminarinivorans]MCB4798021.1 hypothetical protein [Tamlana laminarinivorans]
MTFKKLLMLLCVVASFSAAAQNFSPAFEGFSRKKPAFITMADGTEYTVYLKSFKRKKGLIDQLKVESVNGGKKVKINPEDISHMYIAPSGLAKLAQKMDASTDLTKIQDGELNAEHLDEGYIFMESSEVQIKKKTQYCMLQLMNPTFSGKIKVYNDPFAKETASIGIGGMTLAGGLDKSYYIKKADEKIAKRIKKKEYKKDMTEIFSECPDVLAKYADDPKWGEFENFIYDYSTMCN